jgi:hypothetical protein
MPSGPLANATAALFAGLSRLRGRRIFHPYGVGFAATLTPQGSAGAVGAKLFGADAPWQAVVRLSRSIGLPEYLRDPCGLAIRVPDAYGPSRHQDFLLVSSALARGGRHLVLPARGFASRPYSSLLPYRVGARTVTVGAVAQPRADGPTLGGLRGRERADLRFGITLAPLSGGAEEVAVLELGDRLPDAEVEALRLDPANTGGGLELAGLLNRLRGPAYGGSQDGRGARGDAEPADAPEPGPIATRTSA